MAEGIDIEIQGYTMRVGHELYHLNNIARVSSYVYTVGFDGGPIKALWHKRGQIFLVVAAAVLVNFLSSDSSAAQDLLDSADIQLSSETVDLVNGLLVVAVLAIAAQIAWMLTMRSKWYALTIESSGIVRGILASKDRIVIGSIIQLIGDAIRNPPASVQNYHFTNVTNDQRRLTQINQSGDNAIGQQINSRGAKG